MSCIMAVFVASLHGQRSLHIAFAFLLLSSTLYMLAVTSNGWFIVHPTSYYGVWSVTFCDFLACQEISAVFNDEPGEVEGGQHAQESSADSNLSVTVISRHRIRPDLSLNTIHTLRLETSPSVKYFLCNGRNAVDTTYLDWYHVVQILNITGITSLLLSVLLTFCHVIQMPVRLVQHSSGAISLFCIVSVISISSGLFIFYSSLIEDSPVNHPHISWAAVLAGMTCLLQLMAAVLVSNK